MLAMYKCYYYLDIEEESFAFYVVLGDLEVK